jgi:hypothetical protein
MALSKIQSESVNLSDNFAFTGTVTGAGLTSPFANTVAVTSEGGAVTTNLVQGLAKAWGHFEASDTTLDDSLNTTSITDNSAGNFTANFGNNMVNAHYVGAFHATDTCVGSAVASGYVTSSLRFITRSSAFGVIDKDDTTYIVNGDLA